MTFLSIFHFFNYLQTKIKKYVILYFYDGMVKQNGMGGKGIFFVGGGGNMGNRPKLKLLENIDDKGP